MSYQNRAVLINHIVAMDSRRAIGKNGQLPWHLPNDLRRFKKLTKNGVVIMGSKTYQSLNCVPLNKRFNVIVSRTKTRDMKGYEDVYIARTVEDALRIATNICTLHNLPEAWIIGGAQIYKETMKYADYIYCTHVETETKGDVFYPANLNGANKDFRLIKADAETKDAHSQLKYAYATYQVIK